MRIIVLTLLASLCFARVISSTEFYSNTWTTNFILVDVITLLPVVTADISHRVSYAGREMLNSSGAPDGTPSLLCISCDIRLAIDLTLHWYHTYFVIMSKDSGLWNVNLSVFQFSTAIHCCWKRDIGLESFDFKKNANSSDKQDTIQSCVWLFALVSLRIMN